MPFPRRWSLPWKWVTKLYRLERDRRYISMHSPAGHTPCELTDIRKISK